MEYWPEDHGDDFIIVTNDCDDENGQHIDCAINNKLMRTPINKPDRSNWVEEIAHRDDVQLKALMSIKITGSSQSGPTASINSESSISKESGTILFPCQSPLISSTAAATQATTRKFRYGYASLVSPSSTYDLDLDSDEQTLLKERPVNNYDRSQYTAERIFIKSHDGVRSTCLHCLP